MSKPMDITGQTFGQWTVLHYHSTTPRGDRKWLCRCTCGNERAVCIGDLRYGSSTRCRICSSKSINFIHGETKGGHDSLEIRHWRSIVKRCTDPDHHLYRTYGAIGITVCQRWIDSSEDFIHDMGRCHQKIGTVERIDRSKGYHPGNCRWGLGWPGRHFVVAFGQSLPITEWAARSGIGRVTISCRLRAGWPAERAVSEPARSYAKAKGTDTEAWRNQYIHDTDTLQARLIDPVIR